MSSNYKVSAKSINNLIEFIDKDKNGKIDFNEFSEIFKLALSEETKSYKEKLNSRGNLMLLF